LSTRKRQTFARELPAQLLAAGRVWQRGDFARGLWQSAIEFKIENKNCKVHFSKRQTKRNEKWNGNENKQWNEGKQSNLRRQTEWLAKFKRKMVALHENDEDDDEGRGLWCGLSISSNGSKGECEN